jgi:phage terminase small subunit
MADLTEKQKIFCQEYIYDWNATRAAKVAGYSEKTAGSIGHENLTKPEIQAYITEIQKDLEKTAGISRLRILKEFEKIAFSSIAHLHDTWITRKEFENLTEEQKACISEIQTQTRQEMKYDPVEDEQVPIQVDFIKVKLYDKQKALDAISKLLGYNEPDKLKLLLPEKQVMEIGGHKIEF